MNQRHRLLIVLSVLTCLGCRGQVEGTPTSGSQNNGTITAETVLKAQGPYRFMDDPKLAIVEVIGDLRGHSIAIGRTGCMDVYPLGGSIRFQDGKVRQYSYIEVLGEDVGYLKVSAIRGGSHPPDWMDVAIGEKQTIAKAQQCLKRAGITSKSGLNASTNKQMLCVNPGQVKEALALLRKDSKKSGYSLEFLE